ISTCCFLIRKQFFHTLGGMFPLLGDVSSAFLGGNVMYTTTESKKLSVYSTEQEALITAALRCLEERACYGEFIENPASVSQYLRLQLAREENEVFAMIFLNNM